MLQSGDLCLCSGSVAQAGYEQLLAATSKAGFDGLSMWPYHYQSALSCGIGIKDMALMLDDYGLQLSEFDALITLIPGAEYEPPDDPMFKYGEQFFLDFASELGARSINVVQYFGPRLPTIQVGELFGGFCEKAARHNLLVSLEFLPWSGIPDLATAAEIIRIAGADNGGINLDTWHFQRSGASVEELRALPKGSVITMQLNDALAEPWDDVVAETMQARQLPGQGVIDLPGVMKALDYLQCDAPLAIEVFNDDYQTQSVEQTVQQLGDALRTFVGTL